MPEPTGHVETTGSQERDTGHLVPEADSEVADGIVDTSAAEDVHSSVR